MSSAEDLQAYLLHYRSQRPEESQRLDGQHEIVTQCIFDGRLVLPSVPRSEIKNAVADIGCGTGVWLNDVAREFFSKQGIGGTRPLLVGFDPNAKAFTQRNEPHVQLIEHDCSEPFDGDYHGKFDLVNIRALAYAVPEERFIRVIENAMRLLRPGGFLQWSESEARIWKAYPETSEMKRAIEIVSSEREHRKLVPYLPQFMMKTLMNIGARALCRDSRENTHVSIVYFELLRGGISRGPSYRDARLIDAFSRLIFDATKLLLTATSIRETESAGGTIAEEPAINREIASLKEYIDKVSTSGEVVMGGVFPCIVAQKCPYPML